MRQNTGLRAHGFTILEVMIALGLSTIGMLGLLQIIEFSNKAQKSVANNVDFMNTMMQVQTSLSSSTACGLRDSANAPIILSNWTTALDRIVAPWGTVVSQNQELRGYRYLLSLTALTSVGPSVYTSFLNVRGDRVGPANIGAPTRIEPPLPIRVAFDGAGNVTDCSLSGASASTLPAGAPAGFTLRSLGPGNWLADGAIFVTTAAGNNVGIGTTNPLQKLEINGNARASGSFQSYANNSGTTLATFNTAAIGSPQQFSIKHLAADVEVRNDRGNIAFTAGNVGIGTTAPTSALHLYKATGNSDLTIEASGGQALQQLTDFSNTAGQGPVLNVTRYRGTKAAPLIVQNGDSIGGMNFSAYDGAAVRNAGGVSLNVDGAPGANDMPSRLSFWTTRDGTGTSTEKMRITNTGSVGIGTTSPTAALDVNGGVRIGTEATAIACGAGLEGTIRFHSTAKIIEYCDGATWKTSVAFQQMRSFPTARTMSATLVPLNAAKVAVRSGKTYHIEVMVKAYGNGGADGRVAVKVDAGSQSGVMAWQGGKVDFNQPWAPKGASANWSATAGADIQITALPDDCATCDDYQLVGTGYIKPTVDGNVTLYYAVWQADANNEIIISAGHILVSEVL